MALDAATGQVRWTFTANGPVDTAPTIHRGLCLFGSRSGWVSCLRADDGGLVWRLRVAPSDQRIVAYGQIESPWPVPGSVLVVEDTVYFAAGRQPLADGGILVLAVAPADGHVCWIRRLDQVPPHFTGPIAQAALVHCCSVFSGPVMQELTGDGKREVPYLPRHSDFRDGKLWPNQRPGLGVEVDFNRLELLAEISERSRPIPLLRRPDGSLTNW